MEFVKLLPKLNIKCPQKINCVSDCSKCGKGRRRRREKNWYEELEEEDDYIGQAPPRSSPQSNQLSRKISDWITRHKKTKEKTE
jgi:hypothetical protein